MSDQNQEMEMLLVGSKIVIAWLVGRAGHRLGAVARTRLLVLGGLLLVAGGGVLVWEAATGAL